MTSLTQRKASNAHRQRTKAKGMARLEVQVSSNDITLLREVAQILRGEPEQARKLRDAISAALPKIVQRNALDVFGSDLPDEVFEGVFDEPRQTGWREVEL
jgi:hypothetical protein